MTEASPGVYMGTHDGTQAHPTSVGVPHFFTDVALLRADRPEPAAGAPAELLVRGPHVFAGYWNRPEETAATFVDGGWFRTGDVLRVDDDGWAHVVDRVKDMYISGGENVYPAEVEAVAARLDAVANCAVVGVADDRWGEVGVAYVQLREAPTLTEAELRAHLEAHLARYKVPKYLRVRGRAAAQRHRQDPPGGAAAPGGGRASDRTGRVAAGRNVMTTVAALPSSLQIERHGEVAVLRLDPRREAQRAQRRDRAGHRGVLHRPARGRARRRARRGRRPLLRRSRPLGARPSATRSSGLRALAHVAPGVRPHRARAPAGRRRAARARWSAAAWSWPPPRTCGSPSRRVLRPAGGPARPLRRRRRLGAGAAADRRAPDGRHDADRPGARRRRRATRSGCRTTWSGRARASPRALELAAEDRDELAGHQLRRAAGAAAHRRGRTRHEGYLLESLMAAVAGSSDEAKERMQRVPGGTRRQGAAVSAPDRAAELLRPPAADVRASSVIGRFLDWLRAGTRAARSTATTSCTAGRSTDLDGFWSAIWEFFEVRAHDAVRARCSGGGRCRAPSGSPAPRSTTPSTPSAGPRTPTRSPWSRYSQTRDRVELTWEQLRDQVARARAGLQRLGVGRGDRVVAYLPNIPETLVAFLATASLGAIWASCAPEFGARSVVDRFGQIEPKRAARRRRATATATRTSTAATEVAEIRAGLPTAAATSSHVPYGPSALPDALGWAELLAEPGRRSTSSRCRSTHPLCVLFSSGTTGKPKAIVHCHGGILLEHLKNHGAELGPAARRPDPLVLHHRVDDVERAGVRAAGARLDRADRRQPAAPRPALAVAAGRGDRRHADGRQPRLPHGVPARRACARRGVRPVAAAADRRGGQPAAARGLPLGGRAVRPRRAAQRRQRRHRRVHRDRAGQPAAAGVVGRDLRARASVSTPQAFDEDGRRGGRRARRAGDHRADAVDAGRLLGRRRRQSRYRATYFDTYPGVWRHGDWIRFSAVGQRASSRAARTPRSTAAACGWAPPSSTGCVEELPEVADSLVVHLEDPAGGNGELLLFVAAAPRAPSSTTPLRRTHRHGAAHRAVAAPRPRRGSRRCRWSRATAPARSSSCPSSGSCSAPPPDDVASRDVARRPDRAGRLRRARRRPGPAQWPDAAGGIGAVAVVGTGVIGASWAALFLAHGLDVIATDPAPGRRGAAAGRRRGALAGADQLGSPRRLAGPAALHRRPGRGRRRRATSCRRTAPSARTSSTRSSRSSTTPPGPTSCSPAARRGCCRP